MAADPTRWHTAFVWILRFELSQFPVVIIIFTGAIVAALIGSCASACVGLDSVFRNNGP